ncbi:MAG: hypothetical protein HOM55_08970 [Proteobacteria bacterium]|nr:hypothetical protein [Pseudomonadota bacterium]
MPAKPTTLAAALAATAFGIAFTYNNFLFSEMSFGSAHQMLAYGVIPFVIAFFWRYQQSGQFVDLLLCALTMCIAGGTLQNLALLYVLLGTLVLSVGRWKPFLKVLTLHFALSLYWVFPLLMSVMDIASNEAGVSYGGSLGGIRILDILLHRDYFGGRFIYERLLDNDLEKIGYWILAGCFTIIPVALILWRKKRTDTFKIGAALTCLMLIGIFLAKGGHDPFGSFNSALYDNFFIFNLFRSLQRYYPLILVSLAIIIALLIRDQCKESKLGLRYLTFLLVGAVGMSLPWWFSGDYGSEKLARDHQPSRVSSYTLSPGDKRFYDISSQPGDFKILTNPPGYSVEFLDLFRPGIEKTQGGDAGLMYGTKPFFSADGGGQGNIVKLVGELEASMYENRNFLADYGDILRQLGVRYFIVRKNIKPMFSPIANKHTNNINYILDPAREREVYNDKTVRIIELDNWLPFVWIPRTKADLTNAIIVTQDFNTSLNGILSVQTIAHDLLWNVSSWDYDRFNPTRYAVHVRGANGRLPITLNSNFHPAWHLSIPPPSTDTMKHAWWKLTTVGDSRSSAITKFMGPLGTNGWLIDVGKLCSETQVCRVNGNGGYDLDIEIVFSIQKWFRFGMFISCIVLLGAFLRLFYLQLRQKLLI